MSSNETCNLSAIRRSRAKELKLGGRRRRAQSDHSPNAMVARRVSESQAAFFNRGQGGNNVGRGRKTNRQARATNK